MLFGPGVARGLWHNYMSGPPELPAAPIFACRGLLEILSIFLKGTIPFAFFKSDYDYFVKKYFCYLLFNLFVFVKSFLVLFDLCSYMLFLDE